MALFVTLAWGQDESSAILDVHVDSKCNCHTWYYRPKAVPDITYEAIRDNYIVMSCMVDYEKLRIPDGVPLYCPFVNNAGKRNLYVLRYKKVYKFGEPFKDGIPDTIDCLYENGLLKSLKDNKNKYGPVIIFKYDRLYRITSIARYFTSGELIKDCVFKHSFTIKDNDTISYLNDMTLTKSWKYEGGKLWNNYDEYGSYTSYCDYSYDSCKVIKKSYYIYHRLNDRVHVRRYNFFGGYDSKEKNPRNKWTHYGEREKACYFTPLCAYKPDYDKYIFEYEIHE